MEKYDPPFAVYQFIKEQEEHLLHFEKQALLCHGKSTDTVWCLALGT